MSIEQTLLQEIEESNKWLNIEKDESTYKRDLLKMTHLDKYGLKKLNPTAPEGTEWFNKWDNGKTRYLNDGQDDPFDPDFRFTNGRPNETQLYLKGDGAARVRSLVPNSSIRLFVDNPKGWLNTEITCHAKKIRNMELPDFQLRSRSNHRRSAKIDCMFGNYRVAWSSKDRKCSLAVEPMHPIYKRYLAQAPIEPFPDEKYIGFKQITRTIDGNKVKVEGWSDNSFENQNWKKDTEFIFDGNNVEVIPTGQNEEYRQSCIDKGDKVANDLSKATLWLKPGKRCWIRMDYLTGVNLRYFSIREIA